MATEAQNHATEIGREVRDHGYDIAQSMWGNIAVTQAYLTLSEVLGHLDLLANEDRVQEQERDGVAIFSAV